MVEREGEGWDGDGGRYGHGLNFFYYFFRPPPHWMDVLSGFFLSFDELYTTYTVHVHDTGGEGVGGRASECAVVEAAGARR